MTDRELQDITNEIFDDITVNGHYYDIRYIVRKTAVVMDKRNDYNESSVLSGLRRFSQWLEDTKEVTLDDDVIFKFLAACKNNKRFLQ